VALTQPEQIKVAWTAVTGAQAGVYVAYEMGTWRDLGLDVDLVRMGSSTQMAAALRAGELDGGVLDWTLAFQFQAQGGNAREVSAITNRLPFSVMAQASITRPQDVVGKRWGITRIGSAVHTASLVALSSWGLGADDVQFLALQEVPAILAALQAGQIDVGVVSPPTNIRAIQAGFRELLDLAEDGPEYPSVGLAVLERHITENSALVRAYVAGYGAGVARFRNDRAGSIEVLRKYLQIDEQSVLDETYERFTRYLALPPVLPMSSLERVKQDAIKGDASAANVSLADVAEPRFVEELIAQGYFASL
jgi:ABC-type nitrate/sulfonate/bicarbonate transport system substrate-binding protein